MPSLRSPGGLLLAALLALPAAAATRDWEGAIGAALNHGPEIPGADIRGTSAEPVFYLRWKRLSVSNASGFVTRGNSEIPRGLGLELLHDDRDEINLGLRLDHGRDESGSRLLTGLGEVRGTLRARISARRQLDEHWGIKLALNVDALDRDGGSYAELTLQRDWRLAPTRLLTTGAGMVYGTDRYHQSWFGITPEQSRSSGYPVYTPGSGWRDATLFGSLKFELPHRWVAHVSASTTLLLGPAHDSPITRRRATVSFSTGAAWRF